MAFTPYTASASGNTATGSIAVPTGMPAGASGVVVFTQNNADVLTTAPAWLTLIDSTSSGSTSLVNKVYRFTVGDGSAGTVSPGTTGSFSMSAVRAWTATLYGVDGVDTANPVTVLAVAGTATASTAAVPTATTTEALWLAEVAVQKANGTVITAFTVPTGWTARVTTASPTTFGAAVVVADRTNGVAGAGSYGGDIYTPNPATSSTTERYLIGFRPAPVNLTYYAPTTDTGSTTSGWTKTPAGAAGFYAVVNDTDPATYAESPTNPTTATPLTLTLPSVPVPTDLSTVSINADGYYANGTSGSIALSLLQSGVVKKTATVTLTGTNATYSVPLSTAEAAALTVTGGLWQNLALRIGATAA